MYYLCIVKIKGLTTPTNTNRKNAYTNMEYKYPTFGKAVGKVGKSLQSCETIGQCESVLTMAKNLYSAYPEREEEIYEMINVVVGHLKTMANLGNNRQKTD